MSEMRIWHNFFYPLRAIGNYCPMARRQACACRRASTLQLAEFCLQGGNLLVDFLFLFPCKDAKVAFFGL